MGGMLDDAQAKCFQMEKKAKNFDKVVIEWKHKIDSLQSELDQTQVECRQYSTELFKVKTAYEETQQQLEAVRRENKTLSNEIKDIMDQISEGGRNIHEIDKIRKRLTAEKLELQAALEEAEGALEQEENKVLRAQLELTQVRQEIEHRIAEKDEQFLGIKKNMTKGIESMQAALEDSNANNLETQKAIKTYQIQIRDAAQKLAEEQRAKELARDGLVAAERKAHSMQNALEEARTLLEQADRNRRSTEAELADVNEALSDTTVSNQAIAAAKRKLESEMATLHADMDEMSAEARLCDDKANKAMVDAARLADELRAEQEEALNLERNRTLHEAQVKDMQTKLDEADMNALKGGKKAMNKLESRIRELQSELEAENRRMAEGQKNLRKSERSIKELSFASDEDRKNHERMQALIDQLQSKIKCYKKQIEEAEEIAALNLAKFRKVQGNLSDAEAHADLNEQALGKAKRGASMGPV